MSETHQTTLKKPDKFIHLQKAVDKVFGRPIRIEVVLEKKRPGVALPASIPAPSISAQAVPVQQAVAKPTDTPDYNAPPQIPYEPSPATSNTATVQGVAVMERPETVRKTEAPSAPSVQAVPRLGPPSAGDMPPMDVDAPPLTDDDGPIDDEDDAGASVAAGSSDAAVASLGGDHELSEAKKNAVELLQGRIIE